MSLEVKKYDVIVIGGGGGTKLVTPVAKLGLKVAIIERENMGGTCLNRGCIPSKMMIYPAERLNEAAELNKFELNSELSANPDFGALVNRISKTVDKESDSIPPAYEKNPNIDFYNAEGRFLNNKEIQVGEHRLTADKIFIAVGSKPSVPEIPGLEGTPYMTSREALRNEKLPQRLLVVGGGYIGFELGLAYAGYGSETHFFVRSQPLRAADLDVVQEFQKEVKKVSHLHLGESPSSVKYQNGEFTLETTNRAGDKKSYQADALLMATGVVPCSDTLGLENTSIETDERGFIKVDDRLRTAAPGVWAIGDVVGNYMFRHSVNFEGEYLFRTLFIDKSNEPINYGPVPSAVFTTPQIASVGKTEEELQEEGTEYVVGLNSYAASAMGMARLSEHGFVKVLVCPKTKKFLGAHIVGEEASNMIHIFLSYMKLGGTLDQMLDMIFVHPALPEIARNACRKAKAAL